MLKLQLADRRTVFCTSVTSSTQLNSTQLNLSLLLGASRVLSGRIVIHAPLVFFSILHFVIVVAVSFYSEYLDYIFFFSITLIFVFLRAPFCSSHCYVYAVFLTAIEHLTVIELYDVFLSEML